MQTRVITALSISNGRFLTIATVQEIGVAIEGIFILFRLSVTHKTVDLWEDAIDAHYVEVAV